MPPSHSRRSGAALLVLLAAGACRTVTLRATAPTPTEIGPVVPTQPAAASDALFAARARADSLRNPYVRADVAFMQGMIGHHAQAIAMARLAPANGASPAIRTLCARIINAQSDEIALMQDWLRDRGQEVPEANPMGMKMKMDGMEHVMLMPGMLSAAQMNELGAARGGDFDRLFLTYMIQHHQGAVSMVQQLFATDGAGQDDIVFKFASDVNVDQTTEIARMQLMLSQLAAKRG
jgi:uncharacterized protein (DUF305 family)